MSRAVTLTLPDPFYEPLKRIAQAIQQPLENVLLNALQGLLPPLEGLPADIVSELVKLEALDEGELWNVTLERVPEEQEEELEELLYRNQAGTLSAADRDRLTVLQRDAERVMLRKARAAVLLRFRGRRIPTLAEMREAANAGK